jgi:hypothetical protein
MHEKMRNTLDHISIGNNFMKGMPIALQIRENIEKWYCMKLKRFCTAKQTFIRLKKQPTEWEN